MPKIHACLLSEQIPSLPEIRVFSPERQDLDRSPSLFMCALGFEPRALTIPCRLSDNEYFAARSIYLEYSTNRGDNEANRPALLRHLGQMSETVQTLETDNEAFSRSLRDLLDSIASACEPEGRLPCVLFDISAAANRVIMKCMKVLLEFNIHLKILYSEAAIYHPTREEYDQAPEKWGSEDELGLERGVSEVNIGTEYPGYHIDQIPDCILVFPSFKKERSRAVISEVDPSLLVSPEKKVIWLLGKPHIEQDYWRVEAMRKINSLDADVPQWEVDTFNYVETLRTLDAIYQEKVGDHQFTLSPMGSKLQAVGASLFCYLRPDVRVVFATPKEYNASLYSDGCKETWMIDFGCVAEIRNILDRVGMLRIDEE